MKRNYQTALAVGAAILLGSQPAFAQIAGGGGSAEALYAWFMQNIWAGILLVGIVALGAMWWFGRIGIYLVGGGIAAAAIVKFAPDIRSFFM